MKVYQLTFLSGTWVAVGMVVALLPSQLPAASPPVVLQAPTGQGSTGVATLIVISHLCNTNIQCAHPYKVCT